MTYEECLEDLRYAKDLGYNWYQIQMEALDMFVAIKTAKIEAEHNFEFGAGTLRRKRETMKESL